MLDKQGYAAFEYSAWLADNKENTVSTRRVSVKSWVYKFPEMKISSKLKYDMAPTTLRVALSGIRMETITVLLIPENGFTTKRIW